MQSSESSDLTGHFTQPTGTFTPELSTIRSPSSPSGITTVVTERFHRWDLHPLEHQLASLQRLLPPEPVVVKQPGFTRVEEPTLLWNQVVLSFWLWWRRLPVDPPRRFPGRFLPPAWSWLFRPRPHDSARGWASLRRGSVRPFGRV
jgi:hypothetical protein